MIRKDLQIREVKLADDLQIGRKFKTSWGAMHCAPTEVKI